MMRALVRQIMWPTDSIGILDTTTRRGLYRTVRNQGLRRSHSVLLVRDYRQTLKRLRKEQ